MGWYPCSCCCVERVLIWSTSSFFAGDEQVFEQDLGILVHYQPNYTGDINDYQLVIWPSPTAAASWWPQIRDGNWIGRLVIVTDAHFFLDPPPYSDAYVDSLSAYTGIGVGAGAGSAAVVTLADPLTEGVTFPGTAQAAILSGGTALATQGGNTVIARNRSGLVQFVVGYAGLFTTGALFFPTRDQWDINLWETDKVPCGATPMYTSDVNGGIDFSFTSGALIGTAAAASTATLEFTLSGSLLDADAGRMQGAGDLTFTTSAAMLAVGAFVGTSSAPTFTVSGLLRGAGNALSATSTLTFTTSADLDGTGAMQSDQNIACLQFTCEGRLTVFGAQSGLATLTFINTGSLRGTYPFLSGTTTLTFTATAALGGAYGLTGTTSLTFTTTATPSGAGRLTGTTTLTFSTQAALAAGQPASGSAQLTFIPAGILRGTAPFTGTTTLSFTTSAAALLDGRLSGTCQLTFLPSAALRGTAPLTGTCQLSFINSGALRSTVGLTATTTLGFSTSATIVGTRQASGSSQLSFINAGSLRGAGRMLSTAQLTFITQAHHSAQLPISGSCQLSFINAGALRGTANLSGSLELRFTFTLFGARLRGTGALVGTSTLSFTTAGALSASGTGTTTLTFSTVGTLRGTAPKLGVTTLTFTTAGILRGAGRMTATAQLTFTTIAIGTRTQTGGDCGNCLGGTMPDEMPVTLTGSASNLSCSSCASILNQTYFLRNPGTGECILQYIDETHPCGDLVLTLYFNAHDPVNFPGDPANITFEIGVGTGTSSAFFAKATSQGAPYNCTTEVPGSYSLWFDLSSACDFGSLNVTSGLTPISGSTSLTFSASGALRRKCTHCNVDQGTPKQIMLTLGNAVSPGSCGFCHQLLGSYILTQSTSNACTYTYLATVSCGSLQMDLTYTAAGVSGTITINGSTHAILSASSTAPHNCQQTRSLTVAPFGSICNFTPTTANMTPIA